MLSPVLQIVMLSAMFMIVMDSIGNFNIPKCKMVLSLTIISSTLFLAFIVFDSQVITNICIIISIIVFIVGKAIVKLKINKEHFVDNLYAKLAILGVISVFAFYYFQIFIFPRVTNKNLKMLLSILIGMSQITIIFIVIFIFFDNEKKAKHNNELLSNLEMYTNALEDAYNNMRSFRHDYKNVISSLYGFIEDKNYDGLASYITESFTPLISKIELSDYTIDRIKNVHIPQLKGIIATKLLAAAEKGTAIYLEAPDIIKEIAIDLVDLTKIMGILLDNAIEASVETPEPSINLLLYEHNCVIVIMIVNSFKELKEPLSKLFDKNYSSKGEGRGLGLHAVRQITKKYDHVTLNTFIEDNKFVQQLCIVNISNEEA